MKTVKRQCFALCAGLILSPIASADDMLPRELKGNISRPTGNYNVNWSILVESQEPGGVVKGKFNFQGRSCRPEAQDFTGTYRDGILQLNVVAVSDRCGPWVIKLNRVGNSGYEFNGSSTEATNPPANAYLKGG